MRCCRVDGSERSSGMGVLGRGGRPGCRPHRRGISRQAAFALGWRPRSAPDRFSSRSLSRPDREGQSLANLPTGTGFSNDYPRASAHGSRQPPRRRQHLAVGVSPWTTCSLRVKPRRRRQQFLRVFDLRQVSPPFCRADHPRVKQTEQTENDHPFVTLLSRRGSPQRLSGPSSSFVPLRGFLILEPFAKFADSGNFHGGKDQGGQVEGGARPLSVVS